MYRVLSEISESKDRRDQRQYSNAVKPELIASAPNQGVVLGYYKTQKYSSIRVFYFVCHYRYF